jgi:hypothetical protein
LGYVKQNISTPLMEKKRGWACWESHGRGMTISQRHHPRERIRPMEEIVEEMKKTWDPHGGSG